MIVLRNSDLFAAISRTERLISQFSADGQFIALLPANDALLVAKFEAHTGIVRGKNGQVRSIKAAERPRVITDAFPGRPVLWTIGYERRSVGGGAAAA